MPLNSRCEQHEHLPQVVGPQPTCFLNEAGTDAIVAARPLRARHPIQQQCSSHSSKLWQQHASHAGPASARPCPQSHGEGVDRRVCHCPVIH